MAEVAMLDAAAVTAMLQAYAQTIDALKAQIEWFKRQVFGSKSERFAPQPDPQQMHLGEHLVDLPAVSPAAEEQQVPAHKRRKARSDFTDEGALTPFFDESRVPVETIELPAPEALGLSAEQYVVVGQKVSHRMAQRPGSYVVLKYVRPVIKMRETRTLHCAAAPAGVIDGSRAEVSLVAGVMVDKFAWHLPLYRQHQRMVQTGVTVTRPAQRTATMRSRPSTGTTS